MCAAGNSLEELWNSVIAKNQSGIKKVKACDDQDFFVARIDDSLLPPSSARYDMRIMRIEEAALNQIADDIETAKNRFGSDRIGICVGSCDNGTEFSVAGHKQYFETNQFPQDYNLEIQGADYVSTYIAEKFDIKGPANTFSTACSSSAGATIKAAEMIMAGIVDAVIVGGIDIASNTVLLGFNALEAVSPKITNPFSKNRSGITLGEAGVFYILSKELINQNQKKVELLGWGESADAYHMTSPDPSGVGAEKAIRRALENARLSVSEVGYINLHGTGTKFNDSMEGKAVNAVFGEAGCKVPVSTTKPVTGHTLGAAAALEAAICWKAMVENKGKTENVKLPVQVWDGERDEEIPELNIVDGKSVGKTGELKVCLSNSFAFGGANACLVLGI